jgi:hypothetical protein
LKFEMPVIIFVLFRFLFRFFIHVIWECLCWNLKLDSDA